MVSEVEMVPEVGVIPEVREVSEMELVLEVWEVFRTKTSKIQVKLDPPDEHAASCW